MTFAKRAKASTEIAMAAEPHQTQTGLSAAAEHAVSTPGEDDSDPFARIRVDETVRFNKDRQEEEAWKRDKRWVEASNAVRHFDDNEFMKLNGRWPTDRNELIAAWAPRIVTFAQLLRSDRQDRWEKLLQLDLATLAPAAEPAIAIMKKAGEGDKRGVIDLLREASANNARFYQVEDWLKDRLIKRLYAIVDNQSSSAHQESGEIESIPVRSESEEIELITASDEPAEHDVHPTGPRWNQWAIGLETGNRWHLFRKVRGKWLHQRLVQGIASGFQAAIMTAFADGGGFLAQNDALKLVGCVHFAGDRAKLMALISPELTKLRDTFRKAIEVRNPKANPLPYDDVNHGWRAEMEIGYAVMEDVQNIGGKDRLTFKIKSGLNREELADR